MSQDDAWDSVRRGFAAGEAAAAETTQFRIDFGRAIERGRSRRGWTADTAAKRAGMAPKTWQRLEDGKPVRNESYMKLDQVFGLAPGTSLQCWQEQVALPGTLARITSAVTDIDDHDHAETPLPPAVAIDMLIWSVRAASVDDLRRLRDVVDTALAIRLESE